jgi:hypothetical protein
LKFSSPKNSTPNPSILSYSMVTYLFKIKLKSIFTGSNISIPNIWRVFFLLVAASYGFGFSELKVRLTASSINMDSNLLPITDFFIWLVILFNNFFPVYKPLTYPFDIYPISTGKKFLAHITLEFINPLYIYFTSFYLSAYLFKGITLVELAISLLLLLTSIFAQQVLRLFIQESRKIFWLLILLTNAAIWIVTFYYYYTEYLIVLLALASLFSSLSGIYMRYALPLFLGNFSAKKHIHDSVQRTNQTTLLLRRKTIYVSLLVCYMAKLLLSVAGYGKPVTQGQYISFAVAIALSPALLFTYIFNNYFGYARELWLYLYKDAGRHSMLLFIKSLYLPLLPDLLLTISVSYFYQLPFTLAFTHYLFCLVLYLCSGLAASFYFPIKITGIVSFKTLKNNTNIPVAIFNFIVAALYLNILHLHQPLSTLVLTGIDISAILIVLFLLKKISLKKIFSKLFYEGSN